MKSLNAMVFDLEMNRVVGDDAIQYLSVNDVILLYAIYKLEQEYEGPHSHGPPISDVAEFVAEYTNEYEEMPENCVYYDGSSSPENIIDVYDRDEVIARIHERKYDTRLWSVRGDHIKTVKLRDQLGGE